MGLPNQSTAMECRTGSDSGARHCTPGRRSRGGCHMKIASFPGEAPRQQGGMIVLVLYWSVSLIIAVVYKRGWAM
jgi:hypothetical protein